MDIIVYFVLFIIWILIEKGFHARTLFWDKKMKDFLKGIKLYMEEFNIPQNLFEEFFHTIKEKNFYKSIIESNKPNDLLVLKFLMLYFYHRLISGELHFCGVLSPQGMDYKKYFQDILRLMFIKKYITKQELDDTIENVNYYIREVG